MHLTITDDAGAIVGEMAADPAKPWVSMMLFVSALWAAELTVLEAAHIAKQAFECLPLL